MIKDNLVMFKGSLSNFRHTGCVWGSSKHLARSLTKPLIKPNNDQAPRHILEAGAGAGAVTVEILKQMGQADHLTICEVNQDFMLALQQRLASNSDFKKHKDRITFFTGYVQDIPETQKFDLIICSLPFLNFDIDTVRSIFNKFLKLSTNKCLMTYFEYLGVRPVSCVLSPTARRERIKNLNTFFFKEIRERHLQKEICWLNLFPTKVYTLDMTA